MRQNYSKMNKNIYVKKINTAGDSAVWLVDGALIRKEINENFVKCAGNNQFNFVPKNELWIDEDLDPKEYHYFIDRFIYEQELMDSGKITRKLTKRPMNLRRKRDKILRKSAKLPNQTKKNYWKKSKRK